MPEVLLSGLAHSTQPLGKQAPPIGSSIPTGPHSLVEWQRHLKPHLGKNKLLACLKVSESAIIRGQHCRGQFLIGQPI